jgi:hypothetical protein
MAIDKRTVARLRSMARYAQSGFTSPEEYAFALNVLADIVEELNKPPEPPPVLEYDSLPAIIRKQAF